MATTTNQKKGQKPRESGHYWVKWAGFSPYYSSPDIWRLGAYVTEVGWKLPGDERLYQDSDFIQINENRIPFTKGRLYHGLWLWLAAIAYVAATITYILLIYKHITK